MFWIFMEFVAFPEKKDSIFASIKNKKEIKIDASGSIGLYYKGKCHETFPNETINENEEFDWCSNIAPSKDAKPWITYSLENKKIKVKSFSLRNGCCYHDCCCIENGEIINDDICCCNLYSFSLHGSNDNITWKILHSSEKVTDFWRCSFKTFDIKDTSEYFRYIKLVQDDPYPGCAFCMQVNQIELYGDVETASFKDEDDNDESVSIIGKIRKNDSD